MTKESFHCIQTFFPLRGRVLHPLGFINVLDKIAFNFNFILLSKISFEKVSNKMFLHEKGNSLNLILKQINLYEHVLGKTPN
jgi:hypothetical protein